MTTNANACPPGETPAPGVAPRCRSCGATLAQTLCDLGVSPISNALLRPEQLDAMEPFYPLHARVCGACKWVQIEAFEPPERIFTDDYAYFSSYAESWLAHAERFAAQACQRFELGNTKQVVEVASNDGYLLQYFKARGVPVLGVEPARNVAEAAIAKGIPTEIAFFGRDTAARLRARGVQADLLIGNNVLAHVPHVNDFCAGLAALLAPAGVLSLEFPHLVRLIEGNQFDTIYHEHFSYISLFALEHLLARHGLRVFDVEQLATHGGSLRVYACLQDAPHAERPGLDAVRALEARFGIEDLARYRGFGERVLETKLALLSFLIDAHRRGLRVCGYGAPAKASTLLNYCGIDRSVLPFTVDRSPRKQGCYLPGVRIPIRHPEAIAQTRPDLVFVLPWNLRDEIAKQLAYVRRWGGRLFVAIPTLEVLP